MEPFVLVPSRAVFPWDRALGSRHGGCSVLGDVKSIFLLLSALALLACAACSTYPRTVRLDVFAADSAAGGFVAVRRTTDGPRASGREGTRVLAPVTGAQVTCAKPCTHLLETTAGSFELTIEAPGTPADYVDIRVARPGFEPVVVRAPLRRDPPFSSRFLVLLPRKEAP